MPNPNNPDEAECRRCFDTGELPGTYRPCPWCIPITNPSKERPVSSQNYKETRDVRDNARCEETVVKDGQRGFCDRILINGSCDRPSDHEED
jgi:hypothetical protein